MKKICNLCSQLFTLGFIVPFSLFAQDIQWEKSYGGKHADYLFDAHPTADYGFILAGSSLSDKNGIKTSVNQGGLDYSVWKMDEQGELVWQKNFGGSGTDLLKRVINTQDGGFLLAGTSDSPKGGNKAENPRGDNDFWVIKLDAGGAVQWQKTLGGTGPDHLHTVMQTVEGGYLLGGSSLSDHGVDKTSKSAGGSDIWLVCLDRSGDIKWQKSFGGKYKDEIRSLNPTSDGGFIIGAYSNSPTSGQKTAECNGSGDFWILKVDRFGDLDWQQTYGGSEDDQLKSVLQTSDGNYLAGGFSFSGTAFNKTTSNREGSDIWLIKLNSDGTSIWQQSYNFGAFDMLTSIVENKDGTLLLGGYSRLDKRIKSTEGTNDYVALKVDAEGSEIWSQSFGSDGQDELKVLIETRDGGYLLAGTSDPETADADDKSGSPQEAFTEARDGENLVAVKKAQQQLDDYTDEVRNSINNIYGEQVSTVTETITNLVDFQDLPVTVSIGDPDTPLSKSSPSGGGSKTSSASGGEAGILSNMHPSRQKSSNFGKSDFWVVKLRDKDKKKNLRQSVEAIPNPAHDFTNIIVGYEFEKGTVTVFDIGGRQLQTFAVLDRTIPINLSALPDGIYIVNVRTDKSSDSVKVLKTGHN